MVNYNLTNITLANMLGGGGGGHFLEMSNVKLPSLRDLHVTQLARVIIQQDSNLRLNSETKCFKS